MTDYLVNKIQNGGGGVWGETVMPANPDLSYSDASKIVAYITSLGRRGAEEKPSLPASGSVDPLVGKPLSENGVFVLSASFTDRGGDNIKPLTGNTAVTLRNPAVDITSIKTMEGFSTIAFGGRTLLIAPGNGEGHFSLGQVDLTDIGSILLVGGGQEPTASGYRVELRLGSLAGKKLGESVLKTVANAGPDGRPMGMLNINIGDAGASKAQELYVVCQPVDGEDEMLALFTIEFKAK